MTKSNIVPAQAMRFLDICHDLLGEAVLAVYLHGSIVKSVLGPQSDLDLLLVTTEKLSDADRASFLAQLVKLSARHPSGPNDPRCLDVLAVTATELSKPSYPARSEFIYGEWLRGGYDSGEPLLPVTDPVVTLMIAQAYQEAQIIYGPPLASMMSPIPRPQIDQALLHSLHPLLDNLVGDERNVILTLARMWRTSADGEFVGKDAAAEWAAERSPADIAETVRNCGRAYKGEFKDEWPAHEPQASKAATYLGERVVEILKGRGTAPA